MLRTSPSSGRSRPRRPTATRPASSSPSPPLSNLTAKKGTSIPPTTTAASRTSSHSNVSSPIPRSVDIHKLDRFEEGESKRHDGTVSGLGQQDSDPDGAVDLGHDSDSSSHLTFNDIPLSQVLSSKSRYGSSLHSVPDDATISAAMELIKSLNIGAVLVRASSSDDDIVGIISTRDYIDKVSEGKHPTSAGVKEFMTESPVFAFDDDLAISCLELMTKHKSQHHPPPTPHTPDAASTAAHRRRSSPALPAAALCVLCWGMFVRHLLCGRAASAICPSERGRREGPSGW